MTPNPRAEAERWLADQFTTALMAAWSVPAVDGKPTPTEECARIAADFAARMVAARDSEWVDACRPHRHLPGKVTISSPLPWAEAIKEGGK